jgi:4-hydroxybenzoate polyprenyltransferase
LESNKIAARRADTAAPPAAQCRDLPLAVDLDGTLTRSDTLHEGIIACLKDGPRTMLQIWAALRRGRAAFKREVAARVIFQPELQPYNEELVQFLRTQKRAGRQLGLFTGADQSIATSVAAHLDLFDVVVGSDGQSNLTGDTKAAAIRHAFGSRFAYAGDTPVDQRVFSAAESVILVGEVARMRRGLPTDKPIEAEFPTARAGIGIWIRALRLPHWIKNTLVFVAPVLGIQALTRHAALNAVMLFLFMGMLASATYIINDLLDLSVDRQHPAKRRRPFASGQIPISAGVAVAAALILIAGSGSSLLPLSISVSLLAYLVLTLCYSLWLKRVPMADVLVLAGLFTIRVAAGGLLLSTPISPWLLTFSMLFFLGLAIMKRYAELERVLRTVSNTGRARGYSARDLPILLTTGISSGICAVVIFTIYLISEQYPRHVYANPAVLWGITPILLIWTLRAWHLSANGKMNEDPVMFAVRDRVSLILGGLVLAILLIAWI